MRKKYKNMEDALRRAGAEQAPNQWASILEKTTQTPQAVPPEQAAPPAVSRTWRKPGWLRAIPALAAFALLIVGTISVVTQTDLFHPREDAAEHDPSLYVTTPGGGTETTIRADHTTRIEHTYVDKEGNGARPYVPSEGPPPQAGLLTAGEWIDNQNYALFRDLLTGNSKVWYAHQAAWQLVHSARVAVTVLDTAGAPARGETVRLYDAAGNRLATAVTAYDGIAYLYTFQGDASPFSVEVGGVTAQVKADTEVTITLPRAGAAPDTLDLLFMIDTTGSMSDELRYLQAELTDVIHRVKTENPGLRVRLSVNFYRDEGDEYVVRSFPFTENIQQAIADLGAQDANGGGDYPEAVHSALSDALENHNWADNAVKLVYLVLDAPPHREDDAVVAQIRTLLPSFAASGIRILPVLCSDSDEETEFLMRTLAAATGGTYIFLTGDSGIGGEHLEPTIGAYAVRPLNDLLVDVTNRYCS